MSRNVEPVGMKQRIKSLKLEGTRVEIIGVDTWGVGNEKEWSFRCVEEPSPDMPKAFEALIPEIKDLLELPQDWADQAFKVLKVSWSWAEGPGVEGATMTCRADLECANSPLILNTPHLPFGQYSETGNQPEMPGKLIELLDAVKAEAWAYLNGKRAQGDLFPEPVRPRTGKMAAANDIEANAGASP